MRKREQYHSWLIPTFLKNSAWRSYIDVLADELIVLHKNNMGTMNRVGFSGTKEPIGFNSDDLGWMFCDSINPKLSSFHQIPSRQQELGDSTTVMKATFIGSPYNIVQYTIVSGTCNSLLIPLGSWMVLDNPNLNIKNKGIYQVVARSANMIQVSTSVGQTQPNFPYAGTMSSMGGFYIDSLKERLYYFNSFDGDKFMYHFYPFVLNRRYRVKFKVEGINLISTTLTFNVNIGTRVESIVLSSNSSIDCDFELEADDYYMFFKVAANSTLNNGSFFISNFEVLGIEDPQDDVERTLILRKLVDYDQATRDVLERFRDSYDFPKVNGLPLELLRNFVASRNDFFSNIGSEFGQIIFFYLLGFQAEFVDLYFNKSDYEAKRIGYTQQKESDLFISSLVGPIYGRVAVTASATNIIRLYPGHQITKGDLISDQTHSFSSTTAEVIDVVGNDVYLDTPVNVTVLDLIDIFRKYKYAVNPDPANLAKSSHLDVFFKKKFLDTVDLTFAFLIEEFTKYLPINVTVRFFGYRQPPISDSFSIRELPLSMGFMNVEHMSFTEATVMSTDPDVYIVWDNGPDLDIMGNLCDQYSYAMGSPQVSPVQNNTWIIL